MSWWPSLEGKILSLQQAKYTVPGGGAGEFCGAHKLPGMERVNTRRCQADACGKRAAFAPPGANSCHGFRLRRQVLIGLVLRVRPFRLKWRAGTCTCCASACAAAKPMPADKPAALAPRVLCLQSLSLCHCLCPARSCSCPASDTLPFMFLAVLRFQITLLQLMGTFYGLTRCQTYGTEMSNQLGVRACCCSRGCGALRSAQAAGGGRCRQSALRGGQLPQGAPLASAPAYITLVLLYTMQSHALIQVVQLIVLDVCVCVVFGRRYWRPVPRSSQPFGYGRLAEFCAWTSGQQFMHRSIVASIGCAQVKMWTPVVGYHGSFFADKMDRCSWALFML